MIIYCCTRIDNCVITLWPRQRRPVTITLRTAIWPSSGLSDPTLLRSTASWGRSEDQSLTAVSCNYAGQCLLLTGAFGMYALLLSSPWRIFMKQGVSGNAWITPHRAWDVPWYVGMRFTLVRMRCCFFLGLIEFFWRRVDPDIWSIMLQPCDTTKGWVPP